MRVKPLLVMSLSAALALPPGGYAQPRADAPPLESAPATGAAAAAPLAPGAISTVPSGIAPGVFGTYGGAESRLSDPASGTPSLRAPLRSLQLPDLGDGSGGSLTPQAERRLGERVMREVRRDPDYLDDWLARDYLNSVAAKLSAAAAAQFIGGYMPDFDLFAMRDPQINALSLPGGFIGVNSGLVATTQTESELASVIGHEMGHVLQRHIARMIVASEKSGYAALATMLFGVLAGILARSGDLGGAIAMGGQAFAVDSQLRFSRTAEREADRVGFQLLAGAGYDPYGMPGFFERLERASMSDAGVPAYARTHPLTGERIADMDDRARRAPYKQPRQSPEYGFVRARLRMLQNRSPTDYANEVRRMRAELDDRIAPNVAANWYGIALGEMLGGRYDDADRALAAARDAFTRVAASEGDSARSSPSLDVLAAEIARRAGRTDDAVQLAATAQRRWPGSHAAIAAHLQAILAARRYAQAQALAQSEASADSGQPDWWNYLAQASLGNGDAVTQRRALAEKFALEGAWPSAIRQLREARDIKSVSFYEQSIISARLHEFEARYKEERKEDKDDKRS
ncbi:M48 family metalloprotease [Burkholderia sp. BDU5]|uniref:M48 family metalloprotease n=1 Tax=Burkholderia sp. BDU5 TaxID=1385590 RepID=UPI000751C4B5|nr:M48 family metalloprotease [Burkholderia sp. BDU5]KVE35425.1 peptidase M48 [Burkholderia sp. BDU5]